jgi:hypothetical protein
MSNQTIEKSDNEEQSSRPDESAPRPSGIETNGQRRRGSVVILAAPGTPVMIGGTEEYMRVELWPKLGE